MFKPNTLFILGAASGLDVGFPLGSELKKRIAALVNFSTNEFGDISCTAETGEFFRQLNSRFAETYDPQSIRAAALQIRTGVGLCSSIDHFLELRRKDPCIGDVAKAAIAKIILNKERNCILREQVNEPTREVTAFDKTWLQEFAQICFEGVEPEGIEEALSRVSIVSFNYDRSLEQFVRIALRDLYSLDEEEAATRAQSLIVTHPCGSLGPLPSPGVTNTLQFGGSGNPSYAQIAKNIKTFTEQSVEEEVLSQIRSQVADAETIVFLGFGYHRQNIDLLSPAERPKTAKQILGTAKDVSVESQSIVKDQLVAAMQARRKPVIENSTYYPQLQEIDCGSLLSRHRLSLLH